MSRNKKLLIGGGVVLLLALVAFANFRFKRVEGVEVNTEAIQKRDLESIVSASGKIQPKTLVNISADTMGRVTGLAVNEGDRVTKGQFLLEIDPRNLRTRVASGEASLRASISQLEQSRLSLENTKLALKLAGMVEHGDQAGLDRAKLLAGQTVQHVDLGIRNHLAQRQPLVAVRHEELPAASLRQRRCDPGGAEAVGVGLHHRRDLAARRGTPQPAEVLDDRPEVDGQDGLGPVSHAGVRPVSSH